MPPKAPSRRQRPPGGPGTIDLRDHTRKQGGAPGKRQTSITVLAGRPDPAGHSFIGINVRIANRHLCTHHPVTSDLDRDLPHALEIALLRVPAMTDLIITTPLKTLWNPNHYTKRTRDHLTALGCRTRHAHPLPHDLGTALARAASEGTLGPTSVDAHLYSAAIQDAGRTYLAAVLWQHGHTLQLTRTLPPTPLDLAEANAVLWACQNLPPHARLQITNADPAVTRLWSSPESMRPELRQALTPLAGAFRDKQLQIRQHSEGINRRLARATRDIAASLYASAELTPEEHA